MTPAPISCDARPARRRRRVGDVARRATDTSSTRSWSTLVVLEVDEQRRRRRARVLEQVHGGARHPHHRRALDLGDHVGDRRLGPAQPRGDQVAALAPRRHLDHQDQRDEQREPTAVRDLRDVGGEEREVDEQQRDQDHAAPSSADQPHGRGRPGRRAAS